MSTRSRQAGSAGERWPERPASVAWRTTLRTPCRRRHPAVVRRQRHEKWPHACRLAAGAPGGPVSFRTTQDDLTKVLVGPRTRTDTQRDWRRHEISHERCLYEVVCCSLRGGDASDAGVHGPATCCRRVTVQGARSDRFRWARRLRSDFRRGHPQGLGWQSGRVARREWRAGWRIHAGKAFRQTATSPTMADDRNH